MRNPFMPGVGANRWLAAWVNESRAVALRHVLESARYHGKAGAEARAVGGLLWDGGSSIDQAMDRLLRSTGGRQYVVVNIAGGQTNRTYKRD